MKVLGIESAFDGCFWRYIVISQQNHTVNCLAYVYILMLRFIWGVIPSTFFFPFPSWPKAVCRAERIVYIFFSIWLFEFASDSYS